MKHIVMIVYVKTESKNFSFNTNYYVKVKGSAMFVNLKEKIPLTSLSVARLISNSTKYNYDWYNAFLSPGDIIKEEIEKTYKNGKSIKNKKEINYYLVKPNRKADSVFSPFLTISGDVEKIKNLTNN